MNFLGGKKIIFLFGLPFFVAFFENCEQKDYAAERGRQAILVYGLIIPILNRINCDKPGAIDTGGGYQRQEGDCLYNIHKVSSGLIFIDSTGTVISSDSYSGTASLRCNCPNNKVQGSSILEWFSSDIENPPNGYRLTRLTKVTTNLDKDVKGFSQYKTGDNLYCVVDCTTNSFESTSKFQKLMIR